jgi:MscS family membrane protein
MKFSLRYYAILALSLFVSSWCCPSGAPDAQPKNDRDQPAQAENEPSDPLRRSTPHGTVVGFLQAAQDGKYRDASQYLELSKDERAVKGERIAKQLYALMDNAFVGRVGAMSNRREGSPTAGGAANRERIGTFRVDDSENNVYLVRVSDTQVGEIWLFSSETLATVPELYEQLGTDRIEARMPGFLATRRIFDTPLWRLIALLLLIPVSYGLAWSVVRLSRAALRVWSRRYDRPALHDALTPVAAPATLILTVVFHCAGVYLLGVSLLLRVYYLRLIGLLLVAGVAWLGFRLINRWAERARQRALRGSGDPSGSIILLGQRILNALLVIIAVLVALSIFGVNITAAVAGLGIGSIAVAFAAQKTLENLLGGISILGDEVIRVGETCRIGDHVGVVEDISLRSTRIRTLERTELSVPNGQLATMNVENISRSDKSLFRTKLEFGRATSPDRLSALLKQIRALLSDRREVDPEGTRVRFVGFGESSLDVEVFCLLRTTKMLEFLRIREDLLLQIMKLVAAAGVEFAIPSRSLYLAREPAELEQEAKAEAGSISAARSRR